MKRLLVLFALAVASSAQSPAPPASPVPPPSPAKRLKLVQCWYRDVLGRPGSEAEHAHWAGLLARQPVIAIATAFVRTGESQGVAYRQLAERAFGTVSDAEVAGFAANWQKQWSVRHEARFRLITRPLAKDSPAARITAAHQLALSRPPTPVELEAWGLALAKGFLPVAICGQLEKSDESRVARIRAVWRAILKREPAPPEVVHAFEALKKGAVEEDLFAHGLSSAEYAAGNGIPAE